ncbi:MAG: hypothetical protein PT119_07640 [Aphanizomenon gracile PMC627.10]|nr:hypothetical protein [Aphanizomenon gracile PMC627.10]
MSLLFHWLNISQSGVRSQESGVRSQEFRSSGVQEFRSSGGRRKKKEERRKKKIIQLPITNHQLPITNYQS